MKTLTEKTIFAQILELPLESIVLAHGGKQPGGVDVLLRTGNQGWLTTLRSSGALSQAGRYLHRDDVQAWFEHHKRSGATFSVIYDPTEKN